MSAADARRDGWLIVRHQDALWGLRRSSLGNLTAASRGSWVELADGKTFEVDEILTLAAGLEPRPIPLFASLFVDARLAGLAVWEDQPVALLDPGASLPSCFREAGDDRPNEELASYDA